jgi:hypothetical protein
LNLEGEVRISKAQNWEKRFLITTFQIGLRFFQRWKLQLSILCLSKVIQKKYPLAFFAGRVRVSIMKKKCHDYSQTKEYCRTFRCFIKNPFLFYTNRFCIWNLYPWSLANSQITPSHPIKTVFAESRSSQKDLSNTRKYS